MLDSSLAVSQRYHVQFAPQPPGLFEPAARIGDHFPCFSKTLPTFSSCLSHQGCRQEMLSAKLPFSLSHQGCRQEMLSAKLPFHLSHPVSTGASKDYSSSTGENKEDRQRSACQGGTRRIGQRGRDTVLQIFGSGVSDAQLDGQCEGCEQSFEDVARLAIIFRFFRRRREKLCRLSFGIRRSPTSLESPPMSSNLPVPAKA